MNPPETPADKRSNLFGGKGDVLIWNLMGARQLPPFSALMLCELSPKGTVGTHVQQTSHEMLLVVAGEGIATVGSTQHPLAPHTVIHLPLVKHWPSKTHPPTRVSDT